MSSEGQRGSNLRHRRETGVDANTLLLLVYYYYCKVYYYYYYYKEAELYSYFSMPITMEPLV